MALAAEFAAYKALVSQQLPGASVDVEEGSDDALMAAIAGGRKPPLHATFASEDDGGSTLTTSPRTGGRTTFYIPADPPDDLA